MSEFKKYCEKKNNIHLGCPTIQVGTLAYYRSLDPKFSIADPDEQSETTIINNYDSTYETEEIKDRLIGIKIEKGGQAQFINCIHKTLIPNCLVFCLSMNSLEDPITAAKRISANYDSYYNISNINSFSMILANLILENFKIVDFEDEINIQKLSLSDIKKIGLNFVHKPIKYVTSKTAIIENSKIVGNLYLENLYDRIVFTKDEKFENDREYRILFVFTHPDFGILPVKANPLILTLNPLAKNISDA